jgi:C-terminal processing protease CtpA/Prc
VSAAAGGRSFAEFNRKYVDGREPYPWDEILPLAGLTRAREPRLGVQTRGDSTGIFVEAVVPGGTAAQAGLQPGDKVLKVGEVEVTGQDFGPAFRQRYASAEGQDITIVVLRGGEQKALTGKIQFQGGRVEEDANASAKAKRIRDGILKGTTDK